MIMKSYSYIFGTAYCCTFHAYFCTFKSAFMAYFPLCILKHITHISAYNAYFGLIMHIYCRFAYLCKFLAYFLLFWHISAYNGIFTLMHIQAYFIIFTLTMLSKANQFNKYSNSCWRATQALLLLPADSSHHAMMEGFFHSSSSLSPADSSQCSVPVLTCSGRVSTLKPLLSLNFNFKMCDSTSRLKLEMIGINLQVT